MRFTALTLNRRLRKCLGRRLALEAPGFRSEIGCLQSVSPRFIRVSGQRFVQLNLDKIILLEPGRRLPACRVMIRTTFEENIRARLVQIGWDFIEAIELSAFHRRRVLIPLGRIVSIERT